MIKGDELKKVTALTSNGRPSFNLLHLSLKEYQAALKIYPVILYIYYIVFL